MPLLKAFGADKRTCWTELLRVNRASGNDTSSQLQQGLGKALADPCQLQGTINETTACSTCDSNTAQNSNMQLVEGAQVAIRGIKNCCMALSARSNLNVELG